MRKRAMFTTMKQVAAGFAICLLLAACTEIQLYERTKNIDNASWQKSQVPDFSFQVKDTTTLYHVYVVIRHTHSYGYRNIWLNVGLQQEGDSMRYQPFELALAGPDKWLGVGMDDIYEHRALLFPQPVHFNKIGQVIFSVQHIMRQNPLPGIMQVGIRVEPAK
jgi:gliding motility-associated lipoprotein GldH